MDVTIAVRGLDDAMRELNVLSAHSCPCSNNKGAPVTMIKPTRAPVPGRPSGTNNPEPRTCAVNNNAEVSKRLYFCKQKDIPYIIYD